MADERTEREQRDERAIAGVDDGYGAGRQPAGGQYLNEGGYDEEHARRDPGNPLWDESLIVLLLVAGVALLLFPEPATSAVGVLLIAAGIVAWLVDAIG